MSRDFKEMLMLSVWLTGMVSLSMYFLFSLIFAHSLEMKQLEIQAGCCSGQCEVIPTRSIDEKGDC